MGDPDQNLYSWQGSRVEYLVDFDQKFPETKTVILDQNYRSTPEILSVSNDLIRRNLNHIEKNLAAVRNSGEKVVYHHLPSSHEEGRWIAG